MKALRESVVDTDTFTIIEGGAVGTRQGQDGW